MNTIMKHHENANQIRNKNYNFYYKNSKSEQLLVRL